MAAIRAMPDHVALAEPPAISAMLSGRMKTPPQARAMRWVSFLAATNDHARLAVGTKCTAGLGRVGKEVGRSGSSWAAAGYGEGRRQGLPGRKGTVS